MDKYLVLRPLARTASMSIRVARNTQTQQLVVIKNINRSNRARCVVDREWHIRTTLPPHPNIARLLEVIDTADTYAFVEEFSPNGDLADAIMGGQLTVGQAQSYALQTLAAVDHLHTHHVVHGDIKADNLLLAGGQLRLTDFEHATWLSDTLCVPGRCTGSILYNAPEQFTRHASANELTAIDVWATGIVIYALFTGMFPFECAAIHDPYFKKYLEGDPAGMDGWDLLPQQARPLMLDMMHAHMHTHTRTHVQLAIDPAHRISISAARRQAEALWGPIMEVREVARVVDHVVAMPQIPQNVEVRT